MAENSVIRHIFSSGAEADPEHRFDLSRKAQSVRMREILSILHKHHFFSGVTPEGFRMMLEDLGPSFVKIGQTLASRSEILPKAYCKELTKLQSNCDPLPFELVRGVLVDDFGEERVNEVFVEIEHEPLGSASLAQVHKAKLATGEVVAVKIQRPGVKEVMAQDIAIIRRLAKQAKYFMVGEQMLDFEEVVEELWQTFLQETDFVNEANNLVEFARLNEKVTYITCPKVYKDLCTEYVLVMEYVEGISIGDIPALKAAGYDLKEIGEKILDNYASQIIDDGFFHADPHAGNIIIRDGKIVYIDLGIMGRLSARDRIGFGAIVKAVGIGDSSQLKDALLAFAIQKDNSVIDHSRFLADLDLLLAEYGSVGMGDLDIGLMLSDVFALTRMSKVTLPSSITSVSRGFVTMEGTVAPFIKNDNIINIITKHIEVTSDPIESIKNDLQETAKALTRAAEGLTAAASYSGEALRMVTRGQLKVNMEMLGSQEPMNAMSKMVNRVTLAIIIAGLFIGSSMMPYTAESMHIFGIPFLSFFGYLGAFILSVCVVVGIIRRK